MEYTNFAYIENKMVKCRNQEVLLEHDIKEIFDLDEKQLNKVLKSNSGRFPMGFVLELTNEEIIELDKKYQKFKNLKNLPKKIRGFTFKGICMLCTLLEGPIATQIGVTREFGNYCTLRNK